MSSKNAKFAWDLAPLPVEASMKTPQNSIIGGASLWVMKGHPKTDYKGVAAFMDFLAQTDMQELWHMETGYLPITIKAYEALKEKGYFKENPYQEVGYQPDDPPEPHQELPGASTGLLRPDPQHHQRRDGAALERLQDARSRPWTTRFPEATTSCVSSRKPTSSTTSGFRR